MKFVSKQNRFCIKWFQQVHIKNCSFFLSKPSFLKHELFFLKKKNELTDSGGEATSSQSNQVARHEAEIFNRRDEDNALITQVVLSSVGYIANGGVGLLVIGGLVSVFIILCHFFLSRC